MSQLKGTCETLVNDMSCKWSSSHSSVFLHESFLALERKLCSHSRSDAPAVAQAALEGGAETTQRVNLAFVAGKQIGRQLFRVSDCNPKPTFV